MNPKRNSTLRSRDRVVEDTPSPPKNSIFGDNGFGRLKTFHQAYFLVWRSLFMRALDKGRVAPETGM